MKFIATSDWHLHSNRPLMRTDADWIQTQQNILDRLYQFASEHKLPVVISGDVFDTPTVTPTVLNMMLNFIINIGCADVGGIVVSSGNHDLPYHQWERVDESSYGAVRALLRNMDYGTENWIDTDYVVMNEEFGCHLDRPDEEMNILMLHRFAVESEKDRPPMRQSWTADDLLKEFPKARIIIVGDNHVPWSVRKGGRLVVNCGCLMRRTAGELKHPTGFWVVDTDTLEAEHMSLFDDLELENIDTGYLEDSNERAVVSTMYNSLIKELKDGIETKYDFISTLEEYVREHERKLGAEVVEELNGIINELKGE